MQIDVSRFRAAFYVEAEEHLEHMEAALLQLESAPTDNELLNTIFRAAHSIKGASLTFGIEEVGKFTHVLENLLDRLRDGKLATSSELVELLLSSIDVLEGLIANSRDGAPLPPQLDEVFAQLRQANGEKPSQQPGTPAEVQAGASAQNGGQQAQAGAGQELCYRIDFRPSREFFRFGQDALLLLRELGEIGSFRQVKLDSTGLPTLLEMKADECFVGWSLDLATNEPLRSIEDVFMFLDANSTLAIQLLPSNSPADSDDSSTTPAPASRQPAGPKANASAAGPSTTASYSTNAAVAAALATDSAAAQAANLPSSAKTGTANQMVDGLINAAAARTGAPVRAAENETVRVDRRRLDELINQIGELVIGASMVEQELLGVNSGLALDSMSALGKIVRDLQEMSLSLRMVPIAATFQKMNRVIRDVAKKLNKQIDFVTEGDDTELDKSVVDQIGDPLIHMVRNAADHGIEMPDVRLAAGKAAEGTVRLRAFQQAGNIYIELSDDGKGLDRNRILSKAVERGLIQPDANLSEQEIYNLIFLPGFSTAAEVTELSGRGVGMDVVRRNVEALQGSVSVKSAAGQGSTVTVRLPLTLAILDGLLVRLEQEVFIIPLLSVIESVSVQPRDIRPIVGVGEVISLRGEVVSLLRLHKVLGIPRSTQDEQGLLVIVEDQGRRVALLVDELLGQQQVVIKNLEANFRKVPGVGGATILGDGRVALILDIFGLSHMANSTEPEPTMLAGF
ncbi:MAG: chemotaxis protein CheA [Pirellulaceae bacterium]|nr:chemotaxis protein CheA [Pirellulaceae bacterium]